MIQCSFQGSISRKTHASLPLVFSGKLTRQYITIVVAVFYILHYWCQTHPVMSAVWVRVRVRFYSIQRHYPSPLQSIPRSLLTGQNIVSVCLGQAVLAVITASNFDAKSCFKSFFKLQLQFFVLFFSDGSFSLSSMVKVSCSVGGGDCGLKFQYPF